MASYERCDKSVEKMAQSILAEFETHKPLLEAEVTIDYLFAIPEYDEKTGEPKEDALKWAGVKAVGLCKVTSKENRAKGNADVSVVLDHHHWNHIGEDEQRALLDHELHHIGLKIDKRGLVRDDLGRPAIKLRKHDVQVGWFKIIAERHGQASIEQQQAKMIYDKAGQAFWPNLLEAPRR